MLLIIISLTFGLFFLDWLIGVKQEASEKFMVGMILSTMEKRPLDWKCEDYSYKFITGTKLWCESNKIKVVHPVKYEFSSRSEKKIRKAIKALRQRQIAASMRSPFISHAEEL